MSKKKKDSSKKTNNTQIIDDGRLKIEKLLDCVDDSGNVIMSQHKLLVRSLCTPNVSAKDELRIELLIDALRVIKKTKQECINIDSNVTIDMILLDRAFDSISQCIDSITDSEQCQMQDCFAQFTNTLRTLRSCEIPHCDEQVSSEEQQNDQTANKTADNTTNDQQSLPRLMIEQLTLFYMEYFVEHFDLYRQALSKQHRYQSEWQSFQERCPVGSNVSFKRVGYEYKNTQPIWKVKKYLDVSLDNHYVELEMVQWLPKAENDRDDSQSEDKENKSNDKDIQTEPIEKAEDETGVKKEQIDPFKDYTDYHGNSFMVSSNYVHLLHPQTLAHIPTPEPTPEPEPEMNESLEGNKTTDDEKTEQELEEEDLDRKVELALNQLRENFKQQLSLNESKLKEMLETVTAQSMQEMQEAEESAQQPPIEEDTSKK